MKSNGSWRIRPAHILLGAVIVAALVAGPLFAQEGHSGIPEDWTHHHLIFSNPGTASEAIAQGRYEQWYRIVTDPRYVWQQRKRNHPVQDPPKYSLAPHRDWAFSLGTGTVAANMFPAKFSFNSSPSSATPICTTDYAVYGLNVAGTTGGQANLVALNNLYSNTAGTGFCAGKTAPTVYWAYNVSFAATGTPRTVSTSPVLSLDGSKVIFVESVSTGSYLHVLIWNSADGGTATVSKAPTNKLTAGEGVSSCPTGTPQPSCLVSILLNTTTITNSSPFYDYGSDTVYVGDDSGKLWKVTPVLGSGTPVVSTTSAVLATGYLLTGPVYDTSSGYIFVGATNGVLYAIPAATFSTATPTTLQVGNTVGSCSGGYNNMLTDAPIVDRTHGWVYEYVTDNASDVTGVEQASTAGPFTTKNFVQTGSGDSGCNSSTSFPTHAPDFDNNYYNGTVTSGHIWVCGRSTTAGNSSANLWEIPTTGTNGSISGVTAVSNATQIQNSDTHEQCSPFTEIYTGTTDYLFFGEGLSGSFGSLYGFVIGGGATATEIATPYTVPTATGGTSGIVIDNVGSGDAQASSIYFATQATSATTCGATAAYCAIKLTQSALQ